MNFVFFGTPEFATIILEKLIKAGLIPSLVICNPDKFSGRKKLLTFPPVKIIAQKYNVPTLQPKDINELKKEIVGKNYAFFLVAAYSKILPKEILDIPKNGTLNIHPSLLPRWRGPSPIQSAILNGDEKTGATIILLDAKMDHGPILAKSEIRISKSETYESLYKKLSELGADLLIEMLPKFLAGEMKPITQNESEATFSKILKTNDGFVELEQLEEAIKNGGKIAAEIERKIRALNPEPGVYTIINSNRLKILEAGLMENKLKITKVQPEGKKPMNATDFFRGNPSTRIIN